MNGDQYQPHYSNSSDPSDPTVSTATLNDSSDKISALSKIIENVDLNSPECQELLKDYETPKAFDKVGFARSLGGFFYQFFYALIGGVIIAVTYGFILKVLYPFPEGKAYTTVGNVLFSLLFLIMNIPTNFAIERFIGEHRVKNPAKMVQYIRFYIWYQMMTGVFLVAGDFDLRTLYHANRQFDVYKMASSYLYFKGVSRHDSDFYNINSGITTIPL